MEKASEEAGAVAQAAPVGGEPVCGVKGRAVKPDEAIAARGNYLRQREWLASFATEAEAYDYALGREGAWVEPWGEYIADRRWSVFRRRRKDD